MFHIENLGAEPERKPLTTTTSATLGSHMHQTNKVQAIPSFPSASFSQYLVHRVSLGVPLQSFTPLPSHTFSSAPSAPSKPTKPVAKAPTLNNTSYRKRRKRFNPQEHLAQQSIVAESSSSAEYEFSDDVKKIFALRKCHVHSNFTVRVRPAVNRLEQSLPFIPIIPEDMFSGTYLYRFQVICPEGTEYQNFTARLLVSQPISADCPNGWETVEDGLSRFEYVPSLFKKNSNKTVTLEFFVQFQANSHKYNRSPFVIELHYKQSLLVFKSQPFRVYARKKDPSSCFWAKHFCMPSKRKRKVEESTSSPQDENEPLAKVAKLQPIHVIGEKKPLQSMLGTFKKDNNSNSPG